MLDQVRNRATRLRRRRRAGAAGAAGALAVVGVAAGVAVTGGAGAPPPGGGHYAVAVVLQVASFTGPATTSGGGDYTGAAFTVPADVRGWTITWSYSCGDDKATGPGTGNFYIAVQRVAPAGAPAPAGVGVVDGRGAGVAHYRQHGEFRLQVTSECTWHYSVSTSAVRG